MVGIHSSNNGNNYRRGYNNSVGSWRWFVVVVATMVVWSSVAEGIGVNWGTMMAQPLYPPTVVQMLKDNGIKKVKLFDADHWVVKSLAGTGMEVMVAIPNNELDRFSNNYGNCKRWVKENVTSLLKDTGGVDIRYVAVGNEPFLKSYNGSYMKTTFPTLKNIQKALNEAGVGNKIKAVIPSNADVYESSSKKPSDGNFRKDIRQLMVDICKFLHSNNAPFLVNIYPFLSLYQDPDFPIDYAFVDGGGETTDDNNHQYSNVFDANYDTLVWSLKNAGVPNLKIVIGEIGWPTDGDKNANIKYAKRFYDGFFKKMASRKGTPLRQNAYDDVYLFGLFDENMKSIQPGNFERHWGIFGYDGQPKFPMDFSGKGNDKMPVGAKGVEYLDKQWCVYDKSKGQMDVVASSISYACSMADCTPLDDNSSCSKLDKYSRISYAYNIYFQMQAQDVQACDFQGTAKITTDNPSQKNCPFPIEIASMGHSLTPIMLFSFFITLMFSIV